MHKQLSAMIVAKICWCKIIGFKKCAGKHLWTFIIVEFDRYNAIPLVKHLQMPFNYCVYIIINGNCLSKDRYLE